MLGVMSYFFSTTIKDYGAKLSVLLLPFSSKVAGGCVSAFNYIFIFFNIIPTNRQRGPGGPEGSRIGPVIYLTHPLTLPRKPFTARSYLVT